MQTLKQLLDQRILILDGAMGTMIQRYGLNEQDFRGSLFPDSAVELKGNNDLLCLTAPHLIDEIHRAYLEAGADIIETNSFNANAISMADYRLESQVKEINRAAARIARKAADDYSTPDKPRFVAVPRYGESRFAKSRLRHTRDSLSGANHGLDRRWRGPSAHRNHFRHAQRQSRPFCCTGIYESDRTRASCHALGNSHRERANAIGTNSRSLSYGSLPCRNSLGRFELFVRSKRNETLSTSVGIDLPLLHQCLPQCRTAQSVGRI